MANDRIVIKYDGKASIGQSYMNLGDYSIGELVRKALGLNDGDYRDINAEVEISVIRKPDCPRVYLNGDPCELGGEEEC
jgi:hypothetical protein